MSAPLDAAVAVAVATALRVYRDRGFTAEGLADGVMGALSVAEAELPDDVAVPALGYTLPVGAIIDILRPMVTAAVLAAVELAQPQSVTVEAADGVAVTGTIRRGEG